MQIGGGGEVHGNTVEIIYTVVKDMARLKNSFQHKYCITIVLKYDYW